jgi:hypothetical protein
MLRGGGGYFVTVLHTKLQRWGWISLSRRSGSPQQKDKSLCDVLLDSVLHVLQDVNVGVRV